ncbi:MAG: hypothetical protein KKH28_11865, partial [Elusimicrobia bacterium]|nr:hypothetical protein [Elusimicrobiota bacterium]
MTKREESKIVKANHRKFYLKTWAEEKARGMSLSAFCKAYGRAYQKQTIPRLNVCPAAPAKQKTRQRLPSSLKISATGVKKSTFPAHCARREIGP